MPDCCVVEGCSGAVNARGMCSTHYMQQRRAGLLPIGTRARGTMGERFLNHIDKTDSCWNWLGRLVGKGYGTISIGGKGSKQQLVHRFSYEHHKGPIPEGMVIMHKCDNPRCVNPDHLEAGTQSQNIKDAFARGRKVCKASGVRGEAHGASKLNNEIVLAIRASNDNYDKLAEMYGVSRTSIERIKYRKTWRHI